MTPRELVWWCAGVLAAVIGIGLLLMVVFGLLFYYLIWGS